MATPPAGTKLSLGKLGRATAVDNANYTSKTSLNDCARDSSTGKASLGDFYISAVDNTLDGYPYVDEQTNETYEINFTNENSLFTSRIAARADNFTWTTSNASLFNIPAGKHQGVTALMTGSAIADNTTPGTLESNLVTDYDFNNWTNSNRLGDWGESGVTVISRKDISAEQSPSGSNDYCVKFNTQGGYIEQSFTVRGNSVYQLRALASSSGDAGQINAEISGAYHQSNFGNICGEQGEWYQFRHDFYTSGSSNVNQTLKLKFTAASASVEIKPLLDTVFFERWEGANMGDTNVTITGKYHDDGQSDGFNSHATRYNTAISKVVEIQDTYGGLAIACFLPGTLILMGDKTSKPIEEINVGDEVMSLDLPGLPDEDLGYLKWKSFTMEEQSNEELKHMIKIKRKTALVEAMFYDYMDGYYSINNGYLKVTREHDIFTYYGGKWRWMTPGQLVKDSKFLSYNGNVINIDTIDYVKGEVEVINFDVEPLDIYFAGGVLVHNKGASSEP